MTTLELSDTSTGDLPDAQGWACMDGNEAAARVAYPLSEVIALYPIRVDAGGGTLASCRGLTGGA